MLIPTKFLLTQVRHCLWSAEIKKQPLFSDCFVTPERLELSTQ